MSAVDIEALHNSGLPHAPRVTLFLDPDAVVAVAARTAAGDATDRVPGCFAALFDAAAGVLARGRSAAALGEVAAAWAVPLTAVAAHGRALEAALSGAGVDFAWLDEHLVGAVER